MREHVVQEVISDPHHIVPADQQHRLTDCYAFDPKEKMKGFDSGDRSRWAKDRSFHSGGGGLASTLHDYHRFCLMLLGGGKWGDTRIISRKTLDLMTSNHLVGGGDLTRHSVGIFSEDENAGVGFGLGFAVTLDPAAAAFPIAWRVTYQRVEHPRSDREDDSLVEGEVILGEGMLAPPASPAPALPAPELSSPAPGPTALRRGSP